MKIRDMIRDISDFQLTTRQSTRNVNFRKFKDDEFYAYSVDADSIILYKQSDPSKEATRYAVLRKDVDSFKGQADGDYIEIKPYERDRKRFLSAFEVAREVAPIIPVDALEKVKDEKITLISNNSYWKGPKIPLRTKLLDVVESLFEKGHSKVIYADALPTKAIEEMSEVSLEGRYGVCYWKRGYEDRGFMIDRDSFYKMRQLLRKSHFNFTYSLIDALSQTSLLKKYTGEQNVKN